MLGHGLLDDRVCTEDGSLCQKRDVLLVSSTQSGNPVLRNIYNVRWSFSSVVPDFSLSASSCVIFLSARFHVLHPEYLHSRIQQMRNNLNFCFVLCIVDMEDSVNVLCDINKTSTVQDCTLVCSWSLEESARYLETLKEYESYSTNAIEGTEKIDFVSRVQGAITSLRSLNKLDAITLCDRFGTLASLLCASHTRLVTPGFGPTKIRFILDTFHRPLRYTKFQPWYQNGWKTLTPSVVRSLLMHVTVPTRVSAARHSCDGYQVTPNIISTHHKAIYRDYLPE